MMNRDLAWNKLILTSRLALLLAAGCATASQETETVSRTQQAATFPAIWTPLAQAGGDLSDPINDGGTNSREIVGTPAPAVYVAADATHFMVRLRLDEDPRQGGGIAPFGWGVLFDLDNDLSDYELSLLVDGTGNPRRIVLAQNTIQRTLGDPSDAAEVELASVPIDLAAGGNVQVTPADTSMNSDQDYFLDFAIPLTELAKGGVGLSTPLRLIAGTSNSANSLSLDLAGTGTAPGLNTLSLASSDPTFLDGRSADADGDQVLDTADADNDNDGIPDIAENPLGIVADADADGDRIPNFLDASNRGDGTPAGCLDAESDGVCDTIITEFDADGDGIPNDRDLDSDDDGIVDAIEAGHDAPDTDNNGILDGPYGANGLVDGIETAVDSGAIRYVLLDTDNDGIWDFLDIDSDGDSANDVDEAGLAALDTDDDGRVDGAADLDGDGLRDAADANTALPGFPSAVLPDIDSDGIPSPYDVAESVGGSGDSDGDGTLDGAECPLGWPCPDQNADGTPNYMSALADQDGDDVADGPDVDADNDGVPDSVETTADFDGDGIANYLDLDSDNDGIPDLLEAKAGSLDADHDGRIDVTTDADGDGMADVAEQEPSDASLFTPRFPMPDTDGDSALDGLDLDSDADGLFDLVEAGGSDADHNGVVDSNLDINRNGLASAYDPSESGTALSAPDTDSDGKRDFQDADDDGDGVWTSFEASDPNDNGSPDDARNTDGDGLPDYLDPDDDGDGIPTASESADPNGDGNPSDALDSDHDGVMDALDAVSDDQGTAGAAGTAGVSNAAGSAGVPALGGMPGATGGTTAVTTGGQAPTTGGTSAIGGQAPAIGGQAPAIGGATATGGVPVASGGTTTIAPITGTGGATATGGVPVASGGTTLEANTGSGGVPAATGATTHSGTQSASAEVQGAGDSIEGGGLNCRMAAGERRSEAGMAAWLAALIVTARRRRRSV